MSSRRERYEASRVDVSCDGGSLSRGTPEWTAAFRDVRQALTSGASKLADLAGQVDDVKAEAEIKRAEALVDQARQVLFRLQ